MIAYPNCKINLGLSIVAKRSDGYHELETIFYPVALNDMVEIIHGNTQVDQVEFTSTGLPVPGTINQNLCVKAYEILKKDFPNLPKVKIHLHKQIPMGAGLGGGSSDATSVLKILNQLFNLGLDQNKLISYAAQLGSDCAFFVFENACHATGRGEILNPYHCDLSNYQIVLIHPAIHVSTAWAFSQLIPSTKQKSIAEIVAQPIESWKTDLINDFESPIIKAHPIIGEIKNNLYLQGAVYASMSGSGSSLFGIFPKSIPLSKQLFGAQFKVDII
jgi:4-diphosphocytidyl-2-C-methyl-D-erythritol kinase